MSLTVANIIKEKFPLCRVDDSVLMQNNLPKRGASIVWFLQSAEPSRSHILSSNGNTYYIASNGKRSNFFKMVWYNTTFFINNFKLFFVQDAFDIIQVKDIYLSALIGILYSMIRRKKFVFWLSFPFPESQLHKAKTGNAKYPFLYQMRGILYKFLQYKVIMRYAHHIFVQSEKMKEDLFQHGIPKNKMSPVPMGVDLKDFPEIEELLASKPDPDSIAYLGSMNRVRHLEFILEAFAVTLMQNPAAKLYMIGDGDEKEDLLFLKDVAERLQISESVFFTGFLLRNEALKIINKVSLCVSPFYPTFIFNSTSPTKLVEYLAMGKPCVVNDHPEQKMIIEQSGAGLCVPWDSVKFGEAMSTLLKRPDELKQMGLDGRRYVEEFRTYEILSDKLLKDYLSIVKE